jgi:hypothetical protein
MLRRWFAVLLGALFSLPAFAVGFANDDLLHRLWLERALPDYTPSPLALYEFTGTRSRDWLAWHEYVPWFTDPHWSLRFFRPLSSLSLAVDHWLFRRSAALAHLHSIIWFLLLAATVVALLRRWLPARAAALAGAIYVLAGGQAMSTAWIASRHTLVGGALGALALLSYARLREDDWRPGAWLAPLAFTLGLAASEVALGVAVFVVLYEIVERREALATRVRAALPIVFVAGSYLGLYATLGFGAQGSAAYLSPFSEPGAYAIAATTRVPELAAELYGAVPSLLSSALPATGVLVLVLFGVLVTLGTAALLHAHRAEHGPVLQRRLWFLGLSSTCSLLPMAGGFVGGRMLPLAAIGAAGVVGTLLATLLERASTLAGARRFRVLALVALLALPHFLCSPLVHLAMPLVFRQMEQAERSIARHAEIAGCAEGSTAYLVAGSDPTLSLYGGLALNFFEPQRARRLHQFTPLSMTASDQRLARVSDDTLELSTLGDRVLSPFEALYRQAPFSAGAHVRTETLDAEVVTATGGMPTRVRFRFRNGLNRACVLAWQRGALRHVELPLGAELTLPHEPGPNGF